MPRAQGGGTRPAPLPVKKLRGQRKDRINDAAPEFTDATGIPPESLSEEAVEVWWETVPALQRQHLLSVVDVNQLVVYCEAVVTHRAAIRDMRKNGLTVMGSMGGTVKNPACTVAKESAVTVRSFAIEFGLTPSARTDVKDPEQTESGVSDFFN